MNNLKRFIPALGVLVFAFIILSIFDDFKKEDKLLSMYGKTTFGTVIEIKQSLKRNNTIVSFEYSVRGKKYKSTKSYSYYMGLIPKVGIRYYVLYYPEDPTICRMFYISPNYNSTE